MYHGKFTSWMMESPAACVLFSRLRQDARRCPPCRTLRSRLLRDAGTSTPSLRASLRSANYSRVASHLLRVHNAGDCEPTSCGQVLQRLALAGYDIALSIVYPNHPFVLPTTYGHIWSTMYAFQQSIVRPRLASPSFHQGRATPLSITLHLPSGEHIGGHRAFEEVASLFSSDVIALQIRRSAWVPFCMHGCCWSVGAPPARLRSRLALLRLKRVASEMARGYNWSSFNRDVRQCLALSPHDSQHVDTASLEWDASRMQKDDRTATGKALHDEQLEKRRAREGSIVAWVLAGSGSNQRRIHQEACAQIRSALLPHPHLWLPPLSFPLTPSRVLQDDSTPHHER